MKLPKGFTKMSSIDKEQWLIKKLRAVHEEEKAIKKLLAMIRGGQSVNLLEYERPDEIDLKTEQ